MDIESNLTEGIGFHAQDTAHHIVDRREIVLVERSGRPFDTWGHEKVDLISIEQSQTGFLPVRQNARCEEFNEMVDSLGLDQGIHCFS